MPHKEAVIAKLNEVDDAVGGIGATNTILFDGKKSMGFNTDYRGAIDSLEAAVGGPDRFDRRVKGKTALVLGAGGVGKAVIYGLLNRGVRVTVTDGVPEQALSLSRRFQCPCVEWSARHTVPADLLFNCTPLGMHPKVEATPFEKSCLRPSMIVFDAVYNPERTTLIKDAEQLGCTVVKGVDMFVRQACLQFQMFTGRERAGRTDARDDPPGDRRAQCRRGARPMTSARQRHRTEASTGNRVRAKHGDVTDGRA